MSDPSERLQHKLLTHHAVTENRLTMTARSLSGVTASLSALAVTLHEIAELRKDTDERLNALIAVVDEIVRRGGKPGPAAPLQ